MNADRWESAKRLFQAALERPPAERDRFVRETAAGDSELRDEVIALLTAQSRAEAAFRNIGHSPGANALPAGTSLGPYEIIALIGAGGMGEVYKARDTRLGRTVAIKVLSRQVMAGAEQVRRFEREARAVSSLNHPRICTLHDVGQHHGTNFLVMEFLEGDTLADRLARGRLAIADALQIATAIAEALDEAHGHGIVHRDLKPANVVLTRQGPKLLDFGVAKLQGEAGSAIDDTHSALTSPEYMIGTPPYMAPEQLERRPIDGRTDIFGFGAVLYEMLAGRRAFAGDSQAAVIAAVMAKHPPPLASVRPEIPHRLDALVARCLEKEPERRWPRAADVLDELRAIATGADSPAATAARPEPAVAVLRFTDMSPAHDQEYLCEGIAEEIINTLARVPDLRVAARTSSFAFRGDNVDVRDIARRLNVTAVVEGAVRKSGDRLRVSAKLIDATTGFQLWSQNVDREVPDVFAIQDDIAAAVAETFERTIHQDSLPRPAVRNPNAYDLYLQGRYFWNRRPGDVVWKALKCFEQAVELDPQFAAAWAGIADVYATLGSWEAGVLPHADAQSKARTYIDRALAIDPRLAEAHTTRAYTTLHYDWDLQAAEAAFRHAIALNPNYAAAHHWYSHCLIAAGRVDDSLAESRLALETDPLNILLNVHLAWHHHMARQPADVVDQAQRVINMDPAFHWGHYFLGWGLESVKQRARAVEAMRNAVKYSADNPVMRAGLGRALAMAGDRAEALRIAGDLEHAADGRGRFAYEIALIHLGLEDPSTALDWLERARAERSGWLAYVNVDPRLDPVRADPRFMQIT